MTANPAMPSAGRILDELRRIDLAPASPDRLRLDGRLCRFDVEGARRGRRHGWLVAHLDGERPVLVAGDWRTGEHHVIALSDAPMCEADRARWQQQVELARRQREWELASRHRKTRATAVDLWDVAAPAPASHPYLRRKRLPPAGLRASAGALLVPMRDTAGRLWNVQRIRSDGVKRFLRDGKVTGLYCAIHARQAAGISQALARARRHPPDHLLIAEGWATGTALNLASGLPCAAALSAHNLEAVARALRHKYPQARLTVCADHDPVGIEKATAAAAAVNGHLAVPPIEGEDWWDVWARSGEALPWQASA